MKRNRGGSQAVRHKEERMIPDVMPGTISYGMPCSLTAYFFPDSAKHARVSSFQPDHFEAFQPLFNEQCIDFTLPHIMAVRELAAVDKFA